MYKIVMLLLALILGVSAQSQTYKPIQGNLQYKGYILIDKPLRLSSSVSLSSSDVTSLKTTGLKIVDTATFLLTRARALSTYQLKGSYLTSAVTSVATGVGLAGGTITTTGTLRVDTASTSIISRQRAANTYQIKGSYLDDLDFTSNGLLTRVGSGSYNVIEDNSADWNRVLDTIQLSEAIPLLEYIRVPSRSTLQINAMTNVPAGSLVYDSTLGILKLRDSDSWEEIQLVP